MGLIGKKVQHNKFGEGLITEQDASYVSVKFMFLLPSRRCSLNRLSLSIGEISLLNPH